MNLPKADCITCHLSLVTVFAFAQSQTAGRIAGTIKDPNDAIIVRAEVTVKSLAPAEEPSLLHESTASDLVNRFFEKQFRSQGKLKRCRYSAETMNALTISA